MSKVLKASELDYDLSNLKLERLVTFESTSLFDDVVAEMVAKNIGSVGIVKDNKLIGIVTEKDFLSKINISKNILESDERVEISSLMTARPVVLNIKSSILEALKMMSSRDIRHLPVVNENAEYFMLSVRDVLDEICKVFSEELQSYKSIKYWDKADATLQEDEILEESEVEEAISDAIFQTPLKRIFKNQINIFDENVSVGKYLNELENSNFYISFVMEYETIFKGIITERDALKKIFTRQVSLEASIKEIMTPSPDVLSTHHQFGNAIKNMQEFNYRNMPIVNQEGIPIGNISLLDLLSLFASFIVK